MAFSAIEFSCGLNLAQLQGGTVKAQEGGVPRTPFGSEALPPPSCGAGAAAANFASPFPPPLTNVSL